MFRPLGRKTIKHWKFTVESIKKVYRRLIMCKPYIQFICGYFSGVIVNKKASMYPTYPGMQFSHPSSIEHSTGLGGTPWLASNYWKTVTRRGKIQNSRHWNLSPLSVILSSPKGLPDLLTVGDLMRNDYLGRHIYWLIDWLIDWFPWNSIYYK